MNPPSALAVLDVGKSAARVVGVAEDGRIVFTTRHACRVRRAPPYPHLDVDDTFAALCDGLALLGRQFVPTGIIPVAHGAAAAVIGDDGLSMPVVDYEAEPPADLSCEYDAEAPAFAETLSPRLPAGLNLGRQLAWLEAAEPAKFKSARCIVPFAQYWAWRLCGVTASEISSLGCHTDLWNPSARGYSGLAVRRGWDRRLAPIRPAGEAIGTLAPDIATRLGLPQGIPVHCGLHDSNAAAWRCIGPGDGSASILSTGTWFVALRPGGPLDRLDPANDMLANVAPDGTPIPSIRFMGGRESEAICDPEYLAQADHDAVGRVLSAGAHALPGFATAGGPFHNRTGRIVGADALDRAGHAALALLYVALISDWCLDRLGAPVIVYVTGRFAQIPLFGELLAGLRPETRVRLDYASDGTPLGAALVARGLRGNARGFVAAAPLPDRRLQQHKADWRRAVAA